MHLLHLKNKEYGKLVINKHILLKYIYYMFKVEYQHSDA